MIKNTAYWLIIGEKKGRYVGLMPDFPSVSFTACDTKQMIAKAAAWIALVLDKMRDVLGQLNVQQLILVSHEPKIEGFVDNIIRVRKEFGVTKISR